MQVIFKQLHTSSTSDCTYGSHKNQFYILAVYASGYGKHYVFLLLLTNVSLYSVAK